MVYYRILKIGIDACVVLLTFIALLLWALDIAIEPVSMNDKLGLNVPHTFSVIRYIYLKQRAVF